MRDRSAKSAGYGTLEVERTAGGTFTLYRCESGKRERYRSGIGEHGEAVNRARAIADALKLRVRDLTGTEAGKGQA